jgi:nicotinate-nucleotide pyrophosphorylase (carboxylating)
MHLNDELKAEIARNVAAALDEDMRGVDWTAQLLPVAQRRQARVLCREEAVLCGRPWFDAVLARLDPQVQIRWQVEEGGLMTPGATVCEMEGRTRAEENTLERLAVKEKVALAKLSLLKRTI